MSILNNLVLPKGAKKDRKRRGRGSASGHGATSCRGHKGQRAHGKTKKDKGFEGGQTPLIRRIPKRGFVNRFRTKYQLLNIDSLNSLPDGSVITPAFLKDKDIIKNRRLPVKILGDGKLQKKLQVHAHAFSNAAKEAIEKAGGAAVIIEAGQQTK